MVKKPNATVFPIKKAVFRLQIMTGSGFDRVCGIRGYRFATQIQIREGPKKRKILGWMFYQDSWRVVEGRNSFV
jgi:hypothetical protein